MTDDTKVTLSRDEIDSDVAGKHGVWKIRDARDQEIKQIAILSWGSARCARELARIEEVLRLPIRILVVGVALHGGSGSQRIRFPCVEYPDDKRLDIFFPNDDRSDVSWFTALKPEDRDAKVQGIVAGWDHEGPLPPKPDQTRCFTCGEPLVKPDLVMVVRRVADNSVMNMHALCVLDGVGISAGRMESQFKLIGVAITEPAPKSDADANKFSMKIRAAYDFMTNASKRAWKKKWRRTRPEIVAYCREIKTLGPTGDQETDHEEA